MFINARPKQWSALRSFLLKADELLAFTRFAQNKDDRGFYFAYEAFHLGTMGRNIQSLDCDIKLCLRKPHKDPNLAASIKASYKENNIGGSLTAELYENAFGGDGLYLDPACNPGTLLETLKIPS